MKIKKTPKTVLEKPKEGKKNQPKKKINKIFENYKNKK
jgi:hypothetical protein